MNLSNEYSIPKPRFSIWSKIMTGLVIFGLLGLGIVAYETFSLFHGWFVAAIFAGVIEIGAAADAIGLSHGLSKKNWWLIPALLIVLIVSGWYNYATVERAGAALSPAVNSPWILGAVGIGPLASLFFMAIGVGTRIADHEASIQQWEIEQQAWKDEQAAKARQELQRREDASRTERERQAQISAQLEFQREKARIDAEQAARLAEIAAQERKAKREAQLKARELSLKESEASMKQHEASVKLQRGTYEDFMRALQSNGSHEWTAEMIAERFHVSKRTGFTWLAKHKGEQLAQAVISQN